MGGPSRALASVKELLPNGGSALFLRWVDVSFCGRRFVFALVCVSLSRRRVSCCFHCVVFALSRVFAATVSGPFVCSLYFLFRCCFCVVAVLSLLVT